MNEPLVNTTEMHDVQELKHRLESLQQENVVLKSEIETFKLRIRNLEDLNLELRRNSVNIQVRAEQEEEFISNKLMKKITELKKEKETLALNYEQEEEFLTNDLIRKMNQIREEKAHLEDTLEKEQKAQISKLTNRIQKLENDVTTKQKNLDTLRREKVELENALEQEQEGLVNRLWKKMEKLEAEKRLLQTRLENEPPKIDLNTEIVECQVKQKNSEKTATVNEETGSLSGQQKRMKQNQQSQKIDELSQELENDNQRDVSNNAMMNLDDEHVELLSGTATSQAEQVHSCILQLREEVARLRGELSRKKDDCRGMSGEERALQDENRRLRRQLQAEIERRQEICRTMSESESSLEIDEERQFNERRKYPSHGLCNVPPSQVSPSNPCQLLDHSHNVVPMLTANMSGSTCCNQKLRVRTTSDSTGALLQQSNITSTHPGFTSTTSVSNTKLITSSTYSPISTAHNAHINNAASPQSSNHQYCLYHYSPSSQHLIVSPTTSVSIPPITIVPPASNSINSTGDESGFNKNGQN